VPSNNVAANTSARALCAPVVPPNGTRSRTSTSGVPGLRTAITRSPLSMVLVSSSGCGAVRDADSAGTGRGPVGVTAISSAERADEAVRPAGRAGVCSAVLTAVGSTFAWSLFLAAPFLPVPFLPDVFVAAPCLRPLVGPAVFFVTVFPAAVADDFLVLAITAPSRARWSGSRISPDREPWLPLRSAPS
jgi:hypothetical protein